jgi:hypothetical protein
MFFIFFFGSGIIGSRGDGSRAKSARIAIHSHCAPRRDNNAHGTCQGFLLDSVSYPNGGIDIEKSSPVFAERRGMKQSAKDGGNPQLWCVMQIADHLSAWAAKAFVSSAPCGGWHIEIQSLSPGLRLGLASGAALRGLYA